MFKYDENLDQRFGITLVSDTIVRKEASYGSQNAFEWIQKLTNHLIANPDPMVVPVYKFEVLEIKQPNGSRWGTFRYAYEMKRLFMLDRAEKQLINDIIRADNYRPVDRVHHSPEITRGWRELPQLMEFMNRVLSDKLYTDIHNNNFLKDDDGSYRIIDLEGFSEYPGLGKYSY